MKDTRERIEQFLQLLTVEELKQLYSSLGGKGSLPEGAPRIHIILKVKENMPDKELFKNRDLEQILGDKLHQTISMLKLILNKLEKKDLIKICQDLKKENLVREDMPKSEMVNKMFSQIPPLDLWKSKLLQARLMPKYISMRDIKSLGTEIETLKIDITSLSNDVKFILNRISSISKDFEGFSTRLQSVEGMFNVGPVPDLETYLEALYEEATGTGEKLTPESFQGVSERLRKRLGVDERTFILKGFELLLAHYFLTQVRLLKWKPPFETFLKILKEEFEGAMILENQAEIPTLRERVCRRMGISEEMFDELLTDAWKKEYVKLDVGAPIAKYDVKYLITKEGHKFYYVKLLKR